jgi:hypothetical protein
MEILQILASVAALFEMVTGLAIIALTADSKPVIKQGVI